MGEKYSTSEATGPCMPRKVDACLNVHGARDVFVESLIQGVEKPRVRELTVLERESARVVLEELHCCGEGVELAEKRLPWPVPL